MATPPAGLSPGALAVAQHLLVHGPASRGHLGDRLRLSAASMTRLARTLVDGGFVEEQLEPEPGVGRPRQILSVVPGARHVAGCKLTATTAYGVVCDMLGTVRGTARAKLPAPRRPVGSPAGAVPVDAAVDVVARLIKRLAREVPSLDGVGVSVGGVITGRTTVADGTFLGWHDVDLGAALRSRTGLPVVVSNDVTALAREQLWFGAGRTHDTFGVITVGAGLGFGVVREGVALEALIDNGHLLAHAPLTGRGPRCGLGHAGCVAAHLNRDDIERQASLAAGRPVTFADLVRARDGGDRAATRRLDAAARALGHVVATFAGALQTTRVVLGGEDVAALAGTPAMAAVIAGRTGPGLALDISTEPLTFDDWARGAAVTGIQYILGAA